MTNAIMAQRGNRVPNDLAYVEDRLRCCLSLIEGMRDSSEQEKRTLVWTLGDEINALQARLWRAAR